MLTHVISLMLTALFPKFGLHHDRLGRRPSAAKTDAMEAGWAELAVMSQGGRTADRLLGGHDTIVCG